MSDNRYDNQPALPGTTGKSRERFKPDPFDYLMSCPCGRGDYDLCKKCPYVNICSRHGIHDPGEGSNPVTGTAYNN